MCIISIEVLKIRVFSVFEGMLFRDFLHFERRLSPYSLVTMEGKHMLGVLGFPTNQENLKKILPIMQYASYAKPN